jgi:hypothetical protein
MFAEAHDDREGLQLRMKAEEIFRKSQAARKITQATPR